MTAADHQFVIHDTIPAQTEPTVGFETALIIDYFKKGLLRPIDNPVMLTNAEMQLIRRKPVPVAINHLVTSAILRCADNDTTGRQYDAYAEAKAAVVKYSNATTTNNKALSVAKRVTENRLTVAGPYIQVHDKVVSYTDTYYRRFVNGKAMLAAIDTEINKPTEDLQHPAFDILRAAKLVAPGSTIPAGRVFRLIAIDHLF